MRLEARVALQMNCHPDRSVPGFPATQHLDKPAYAPFRKERRMKFAEATNFQRKSGVAQWSDCFFPFREYSHTLRLCRG
jgi:hypothetical protein